MIPLGTYERVASDLGLGSQLYVALMHKLRGSLMCWAYFLTCYPRVFVHPAMLNVRWTGARNKCLYVL